MAASTASRIVPTSQNPDLVTCTVLVDEKKVSKKYQLAGITVQSAINKIPFANLVLMDGEASKETFEISDLGDFLPGKKIEIKFGYHNDEATIFKGIIITNSHKITDTCAELHVECKDEVVKMTVNKGNRHYNDIVDSDIAKKILSDHNISDTDVKDSKPRHEQLVQSNISDWDFMISRIDVNGLVCIIKNGKVNILQPKLDAAEVLTLTYGADILELQADMDARTQTTAIKTYTWDIEKQEMRVVDSEDSGAPEEGKLQRDKLAKAVNDQPTEIKTSTTMTQEETQALTNALKLRRDLSKIKATVKYQGTLVAWPGDFIKINGAGDNFNGKAFVSAVRHEYTEGDWVTEATLGWSEKSFAEEINPAAPAAASGQVSSISGLHIAKATGIIDKNGQYRVKVKLPAVNDQDDGIFARVATLDAGNKRGFFFRPEKDDEVVVAFMNDDPRHPVILGMLHSSKLPAPLEPEDGNPEKGYVSRSGIQLIFNDDKNSVHITTPGNRTFILNDDDGSITVKDDNDNSIVIDSNGISIQSKSDINLKAENTVSISARKISVAADTDLSLQGQTRTSLSSSGMMEVKGQPVFIN